ncbi:ras-related protein Rab-36-like [Cimex lectularius]|uniref:Ras-related protein Rab-34 n=1 Tax=Cimex lectularius TaxID=79782 RepID=A0A8I6S313_CIMLE|nr:ras-related protein Rab-36-like [Cimex lectularius]
MSTSVEPTAKKISIFGQPFNIFESPYETEFDKEVVNYCNTLHLEELKCGKVVFIGDVGVGKTSIIQRFIQSIYLTEYKPTIGVDFEVAKFEILGIPFNLQIWDTAGQEKFKCLAPSYYRSAHVIVIVFDVTKMTTLANCVNWYKSAMKEYNNDRLPYIIVLGNKIDAIGPLAFDKLETYATQMSTHLVSEFWPVSSKTGANITRLFQRIASLSFQAYILNEIQNVKKMPIATITLQKKKNQKKKKHQSCKSNSCN